MHSAEDTMSKAILKDGMARRAKSQTIKFGLHKISTKHNNNLKTILK